MSENKHLVNFDTSPVIETQQLKPWKLFFVTFCVLCGPLQDRSGRALQLIAIRPGSINHRWNGRREALNRTLQRARWKRRNAAPPLLCSSKRAFKAGSVRKQSFPFPVCVTRGMTAQLKCEGKPLYYSFLCLDMFFLPRTCESIVITLTSVMKRDGRATGITFVWTWTLTLAELSEWKRRWWVCWCQGWFVPNFNKGRQKSFPNNHVVGGLGLVCEGIKSPF